MDCTFRPRQIENLAEIPSQMVNDAERKTATRLLFKECLQLVTGDLNELAIPEFLGDVVSNAV